MRTALAWILTRVTVSVSYIDNTCITTFISRRSLSIMLTDRFTKNGIFDVVLIYLFILSFNWNHFEMRLLNLRIIFYLLRTFCPHLGRVFFVCVCCFFFHNVSAKYHLWPSSGDLPRPRIGILGIPLQDSSFLSEVAVKHMKKTRGEIWPKRTERRNNTQKKQNKKKTKMRTKSPQ